MSENKEENKEFVIPPLDEKQIKKVMNFIEAEVHPLRKTPLHKAFPWCCCCVKHFPGPAPTLEGELPACKEALMGQDTPTPSDAPAESAEVRKEPILSYGFGISAYLNIMFNLMWLFIAFSIIAAPMLLSYTSGAIYEEQNLAIVGNAVYSLGNMGYATQECYSSPIEVGRIALSCPQGQQIGRVLDYGVNDLSASVAEGAEAPHEVGRKDLCMSDSLTDLCKPSGPALTSILDGYVGQQSVADDFQLNTLFGAAGIPAGCGATTDDYLFISYTCVPPDSAARYSTFCLISVSGVLIALLFTLYVRMAYQGGKIQNVEFDVATVTAGDYAIEMKIPQESYEKWLAQNGPEVRGSKSPALAFKEALRVELERILEEHAVYQKAETPEKSCTDFEGPAKVAEISFAYRNQELIGHLRDRGEGLNELNFDQVYAAEKAIDEAKLIKEMRDKWYVPESCFVIFETDDAKEVAEDASDRGTYQVLDWTFETCEVCSEPTDIIWQNRWLTVAQETFRKFIVFSASALILFASFCLLFYISQSQKTFVRMFPEKACVHLENSYGDSLEKYAYDDYLFVQSEMEADRKPRQSQGTLKCFCEAQQGLLLSGDLTQEELNSVSYGSMHPQYDVDALTDGQGICEWYLSMAFMGYVVKTALGLVITVVNTGIRMLVIRLITWINYKTETQQLIAITRFTFYAQFFNTAFLLLMVNANLEEQPMDFFLTTGSYADFNSGWSVEVGNIIVYTMSFNAVFPLINIGIGLGLVWFYRCLDRGCKWTADPEHPTKSRSLPAYIEIMSGYKYEMHYMYSAQLNICFVTLMYGYFLPYLFPVAAFALGLLYVAEKAQLYYTYRRPPSYDQQLSEQVLDTLQKAPIFMMFFGYWMLSSRQLIDKDVVFEGRQYSSDASDAGHTVQTLFEEESWNNPAWPLLILGIVFTLMCIFGEQLNKLLNWVFPSTVIDLDPNEDIGKYWETLCNKDLYWTVKEEEQFRNMFKKEHFPRSYEHVKTLDEYSYKTMMAEYDQRQAKEAIGQPSEPKNPIKGVHCYDILANPDYFDDFNYISVYQPGELQRADYIIDDDSDEDNDDWVCDKVKVGLNMAYLPDDIATSFTFNDKELVTNQNIDTQEDTEANRTVETELASYTMDDHKARQHEIQNKMD